MAEIAATAPLSGKSWFITGLGVAQIASWGSLYYSLPLIAAAMESDLGWDKTLIYGSATVGTLLSALLAIPIWKAIDRGQGRTVMSGASVLAVLLLVLWGLTDNWVLFYIGSAGIGALQAATLYEPAFALVARRGNQFMPAVVLRRWLSGVVSHRPFLRPSSKSCSIFMAGVERLEVWRRSTCCFAQRFISA